MDSPLQLELTRHELFAVAPGTPTLGPAIRVEVTPEDRPSFFAIARLVIYAHKANRDYYRVFFRSEERAHDEIFSSGSLFGINTEKGPPSSEELWQRTVDGANRKSVARAWQPPDLSYCLFLTSNGRGRIIEQQGEHSSRTDFYWRDKEASSHFQTWSSPRFHAFCRQLISNPDSECHFFLNWQNFSSKEKRAFITRCDWGEWEQLLRLLTCVLILITHHFGSYPYDNNTVSWWHFASPIEKRHDRPAVFFARRWQEALYSVFRPSFWPDIPSCVLRWWQNEREFENYIHCQLPTMHEVLEAQLRLRDFLRPYLSTAEIDALLTP